MPVTTVHSSDFAVQGDSLKLSTKQLRGQGILIIGRTGCPFCEKNKVTTKVTSQLYPSLTFMEYDQATEAGTPLSSIISTKLAYRGVPILYKVAKGGKIMTDSALLGYRPVEQVRKWIEGA